MEPETQQTKAQYDEEMAAAWNEAAGQAQDSGEDKEDGAANTTVDESQEETQPPEGQEDGQGEEDAEGRQTQDDDEGNKEAPASETPATEVNPTSLADLRDEITRMQKELNDAKAWKGRLQKEQERSATLEAQLNKLTHERPSTERNASDDAPSQTEQEKPADETPEAWKRFRQDYGDEMADAIEALMGPTQNNGIDRVLEQRLAPIEKTLEDTRLREHFATIKGKHPDHEQILESSEFTTWVESHHPMDQQKWRWVQKKRRRRRGNLDV